MRVEQERAGGVPELWIQALGEDVAEIEEDE